MILSDLVENKAENCILHSCWPLNRRKNIERTLIGMATMWPWPPNRGGCLKGVLFTVFTDNRL